MSSGKNIVLLGCGAFNPPTFMHLRLFEIAKDALTRKGYRVIAGMMSPVHDGYGKKELITASDRCAMVKVALQSSSWVRLSDWESKQESWVPTRQVLQHHQNTINSVLNNKMASPKKRQRREEHSWLTESIISSNAPVQVLLLCGADWVDTFTTPGIWNPLDVESIVGEHGLVVVSRADSNPYKVIYESDLLTKYQNNIHIVMEWVANEVNSTKIRRALRREESVKYLIPEPVIKYIKQNSLYSAQEKSNAASSSLSPNDESMSSPTENKINANIN